MIKEMTINLGGQDRPLKFGTMGVLKFVSEVTGVDPLSTSSNNDQYKLVHGYVYAGLKCAGASVTVKQVDDWVQQMTFEEGIEVVKSATQATLGDSGEDKGEATEN